MKIVRDKENGTMTFVPVEPDEEGVIASILAVIQPEDTFYYAGRSQDGDTEDFCMLNFYIGGTKEKRNEVHGNLTIVRDVIVGGIHLVLCGSTEEDKIAIGRLRDLCFFGSVELAFFGEQEVDGKKAIVVFLKKCKLCGKKLLSMRECSWSICSACSEKCEHEDIRGPIHGRGLDIGVGYYCKKCGRVKPKVPGERELTTIEHHLAVEREGFVDKILYKDSVIESPTELVRVIRILRKLEKARERVLAF